METAKTIEQVLENDTVEQTYQVELYQSESICIRDLFEVAIDHVGSLGNDPTIMIEMLELFNEKHKGSSEYSTEKRHHAYLMVSNYLKYSNVVSFNSTYIDDVLRSFRPLCDSF